ncbi:MAG: hypothetical protein L0Z62_21035 [Gemmataceae bacterium]|nr:hypothetical protein [Gemmataceae bacterium]
MRRTTIALLLLVTVWLVCGGACNKSTKKADVPTQATPLPTQKPKATESFR